MLCLYELYEWTDWTPPSPEEIARNHKKYLERQIADAEKRLVALKTELKQFCEATSA